MMSWMASLGIAGLFWREREKREAVNERNYRIKGGDREYMVRLARRHRH